jgi:hypothetical protein
LKSEEKNPYGIIPYFVLFTPILASPFLDKSFYSMSLLISWALALFVCPIFLLMEREMKPNYRTVLKLHLRGEELPKEPRESYGGLYGLLICLALVILSLLITVQTNNQQEASTYALIAFIILSMGAAYSVKKNWLEFGWLMMLPAFLALILLGVDFVLLYTLLAISALALVTIDFFSLFKQEKLQPSVQLRQKTLP